MDRESDVQRLSVSDEDDEKRHSRLSVAVDFVTPVRSPIWVSLHTGCRMLLPAGRD